MGGEVITPGYLVLLNVLVPNVNKNMSSQVPLGPGRKALPPLQHHCAAKLILVTQEVSSSSDSAVSGQPFLAPKAYM